MDGLVNPMEVDASESVKTAKVAYGEYLASRLNGTADGFQRLADQMRAAAASVPSLGSVGNVNAGNLAQRVIHDIVWGLANASPDAIVSAAAEYDRNVTYADTDKS